MAILVRGVAGQDGGDVEDDASFLVGEGVLGSRFVCERIEPDLSAYTFLIQHASGVPCKADLDMILIDRKPQIQQFQLSVVSIQQVPSSRAVFPCAPHVLP